MSETSRRLQFGRALFFFGKRRADEAEQASTQQRKQIQDRIDLINLKLRAKLEALEEIFRKGTR